MSAPAPDVLGILIDELSEVTPAMVDAGVAAVLDVTTTIDSRGRRQPTAANAATEFSAIWRAMLAAKLSAHRAP